MRLAKRGRVICQCVELNGIRYAIVREEVLRRVCRRCGIELVGSERELREPQGELPPIEQMDQARLAAGLVRRRKQAELSQAELARRAGVRIETLNRIERGRTMPDFSTIRKLLTAIKEAEARLGIG